MMKPREDFGLFEYQTNDGKELYGVRLRIKGRRKEWQGFQTLARGRPQSRHVNRRMAKLLRGFRLAAQQDPPLVTKEPPWQALDEAPPRSGFLEWNTFTQIRTAMRRLAQIPVTIAFWTGMRIGETLSLTWSQLTFDHHRRWAAFNSQA